MGCPDVYYKLMLQKFVYVLISSTDSEKAISFLNENDVVILESEALKLKQSMSENQFYFYAGRSCQVVLDSVLECDCDDEVNACVGSFSSFINFIGLS